MSDTPNADKALVPTNGTPTAAPVVPAAQIAGAPAEILDHTNSRLMIWPSWELKDANDKALVMRCLSDPDVKAEDLLNQTFRIFRYFYQVISLCDPQTGEVRQAVRTVLVIDDWKTVAFVSDGVVQSVQALALLYGRDELEKGIACTLKSVKTRSGFRTYKVEAVIVQTTPPGKKGR